MRIVSVDVFRWALQWSMGLSSAYHVAVALGKQCVACRIKCGCRAAAAEECAVLHVNMPLPMLTYLSLSPPLSCSPFSLLFYALREKRHFKCRTKLLKHALAQPPLSLLLPLCCCMPRPWFIYLYAQCRTERKKQASKHNFQLGLQFTLFLAFFMCSSFFVVLPTKFLWPQHTTKLVFFCCFCCFCCWFESACMRSCM